MPTMYRPPIDGRRDSLGTRVWEVSGQGLFHNGRQQDTAIPFEDSAIRYELHKRG